MTLRLDITAVSVGLLLCSVARADKETEVAPTYAGSRVVYDDDLGFNPFGVCVGKVKKNKPKIRVVEGRVRHRFAYAPAGRSAYEIIKNYETAVKAKDGDIFEIADNKACVSEFMKSGHPGHGMQNYEYMQLGNYGGKYFAGRISVDEQDYYVAVVGADIDGKVVYALVTIQEKAMDQGMVTLENLEQGLGNKGHVAVYDIFFDSGKSVVKEKSERALGTIAEYIKSQRMKKYYIVGHTDNVGDFEMNLQLSMERARAVVKVLVDRFGVSEKQLRAYGVGPVAPVKSNKDDEGRTKNRRVEIVEQ